MTELNDNAPLTVTLKGGVGYDAPWLVVRGSSPEQVVSMLRNLGDLPAAVVDAAQTLKAVNNLTPITHDAPPPVQQAPPPQQQAWPNSAPQQPQGGGGGGGRFGGVPHPEGKQCSACGNVLIEKTTGGGKKAWRCDQWRWNNGNPNNHTSEWA